MPTWLLFALGSAFVATFRRPEEKKLSATFTPLTMSTVSRLVTIIPAFILMQCFHEVPQDIFHLPKEFWVSILVIWFIFAPVQSYTYYKAMRSADLSHIMPIMSLLPVLNAISSYYLIGEVPSFYGWIGISLIVFASAMLMFLKKENGKREYHPPVMNMVIATMGIAFGSTLDKIAVQASTPFFYSFANIAGSTLTCYVGSLIMKEKLNLKDITSQPGRMTYFGVNMAISFGLALHAFKFGQSSYSLAVRSLGFMLPAFWGLLFLKEKLTGEKIIAIILTIIGVIIMAFA